MTSVVALQSFPARGAEKRLSRFCGIFDRARSIFNELETFDRVSVLLPAV